MMVITFTACEQSEVDDQSSHIMQLVGFTDIQIPACFFKNEKLKYERISYMQLSTSFKTHLQTLTATEPVEDAM